LAILISVSNPFRAPPTADNGIFGLSMGGLKAILAAAAEPERIKALFAGLVGGNIPSILAETTEESIARRRRQYLRETRMSVREYKECLRYYVAWDPLSVAPCVDPEKTRLVLAVFDTTVPFKYGCILWKAMHKPKTLFLLSGHYTSVADGFYVRRVALNFFREKFHMETRVATE